MTLVPAVASHTPAPRSARTSLARLGQDPRDAWPPHARRLFEYLAAIYGEHDVLCTLAAAWIAHHHQRSPGTAKTYAQNFKLLEAYARQHDVHPLGLRFLLADAFAANLENLPTLVWREGRRVPEGPPRGDATRHNVLSACSSFYVFLLRTKLLPKEQLDSNPFEAVLYPAIDPLYSRTEAFTKAEFATLLRTARDGLDHRGNRWPTGHRLYTELLMLHDCCLRIESALGARIERLGQDGGHRVLDVEVKGGYWVRKAVPPLLWAAIQEEIGDRTEGYILATRTGRKLDEPSQWRAINALAKRAGLPQRKVGPHAVKHTTITHALARPGARRDRIQHWADHKDPRTTDRYNRRRGALDGSPGYEASSDLAEELANSDCRIE
ncbi:tyrosine-type recombinase/integrase [Streptomyces xanthophaeus]|uniref:tyrosine-type recombinase/integrase n=1 Tax=Streptomyces xanthophaeus TaxID=67385 RepID=UPI0004CD352D|nr:tyrosine-type recombinase/integrase [Streptomyces xanthophaeus]